MEESWVTELHVRMDCNGCVQKIKKAMHRVDGVRDVNVDIAQQKITVVGRADPETLLKAIKKTTKKKATICSHTEPAASDPPPAEPEAAPPAEVTVTPEPPKDIPPQETPAAETTTSPEEPQVVKEVEKPQMVHHYPHNYAYREHWNNYTPIEHDVRHQAPYHVTHSYSSHRPSPYVSEYVSEEYGYAQSPPSDTRYHREGGYGDGYNNYQNRGGDGNQISSMFSDENPNACRIT